MTGFVSLLPPNATPLERAVERTTAPLGDIPVPISTVWDPETCPAPLLPWLAWAYSVDVWDSSWSERTKRAVIAAAYDVHRHKGSVWSVEEAIRAAGFEKPTVIENLGRRTYNGEITHNGMFFHGWERAWALYRVVLNRPIRNDQVVTVRAILDATAPARSQLLSLDFRTVANLYDGRSSYDGAYNHGSA